MARARLIEAVLYSKTAYLIRKQKNLKDYKLALTEK
jgi:hypothetical protein